MGPSAVLSWSVACSALIQVSWREKPNCTLCKSDAKTVNMILCSVDSHAKFRSPPSSKLNEIAHVLLVYLISTHPGFQKFQSWLAVPKIQQQRGEITKERGWNWNAELYCTCAREIKGGCEINGGGGVWSRTQMCAWNNCLESIIYCLTLSGISKNAKSLQLDSVRRKKWWMEKQKHYLITLFPINFTYGDDDWLRGLIMIDDNDLWLIMIADEDKNFVTCKVQFCVVAHMAYHYYHYWHCCCCCCCLCTHILLRKFSSKNKIYLPYVSIMHQFH